MTHPTRWFSRCLYAYLANMVVSLVAMSADAVVVAYVFSALAGVCGLGMLVIVVDLILDTGQPGDR